MAKNRKPPTETSLENPATYPLGSPESRALARAMVEEREQPWLTVECVVLGPGPREFGPWIKKAGVWLRYQHLKPKLVPSENLPECPAGDLQRQSRRAK